MSSEFSDQLAYDYGAFWQPRDADRIIARMFELHPHHEKAYVALARNMSAHGRYLPFHRIRFLYGHNNG